jgi:hypothetical protein
MVRTDAGAKGRVDPGEILRDPRVSVFWDEGKRIGRWYEENVTKLGRRSGDDARIEWDAYFLYAREARWNDDPPRVVSWGRTIYGEKERFARDLTNLLARPTSEP